MFEVLEGDCLAVLRGMAASSVDAVVTDPPYGLSFMGKKWDYDVPTSEVWAECLRVLKPGGHLLSFAGTRTQHRMATAIEDGGFDIRDMIAWVYGQGFPKSHDVSKAVDKALGVPGAFGAPKSAAHAGWISRGRMRGGDGHEGYQRPWMANAEAVDNNAREYVPGSVAAAAWSGWGTALKPAMEPITVARKPLGGTVAANVLAHGVGGLNIDGCRVAIDTDIDASQLRTMQRGRRVNNQNGQVWGLSKSGSDEPAVISPKGRFPANIIHDGSDEVLDLFPDSAGQLASVGPQHGDRKTKNCFGDYGPRPDTPPRGDSGSAARFFYCAKASKSDRGEGNNHPTVKPTALMRYLCRLITPPGGVVLDPFSGSGSTGVAAIAEGFRYLGIEYDPAYAALSRVRLAKACAEICDLV